MIKTTLLSLLACLATNVVCAQGWRLAWADEFNYNGLPDSTKWGYEEGALRNHEKQYYTRERMENARVENGHLILEARKEQYDGYGYTSASINTMGKASWTYGRVEVRAKLPTGFGTWPAIWMLGTNFKDVGWPRCGEIDIMENVGFDPDAIHANIHTEAYNHVKGTGKGSEILISKPYDDYHVYAMAWTADTMDFYVDDHKYFTFVNEGTGAAAWPYDKPQYLLLNIAIGGDWGGRYGINDNIFPQQMLIDYVRVYQRE